MIETALHWRDAKAWPPAPVSEAVLAKIRRYALQRDIASGAQVLLVETHRGRTRRYETPSIEYPDRGPFNPWARVSEDLRDRPPRYRSATRPLRRGQGRYAS